MKFISLFILISAFPLLLCYIGGAVAAVNETMAYAFVNHYYDSICKKIQDISVDEFRADGITVRYGHLNITYFDKKKLTFKFNSDSIKVSVIDLRGVFSGRGYKKIWFDTEARNFDININRANIDIYFKIKSKYSLEGLVPDIEVINSKSDVDFTVDVHGFLGGWMEGAARDIVEDSLGGGLTGKANELLQKGLENIKMNIGIDVEKGYYLDATLASNVEMRNGFFTINSYALFYNAKLLDTKNKYRLSLTEMPTVESIGEQFEILVSEYSINSCLYTLQRSNELNYKVVVPSITTQILEEFAPGSVALYGDKNIEFDINLGLPEVKITEQYFNIEGPAVITIKGESLLHPYIAFIADIKATIDLEITYGLVKGKIIDFEIDINNIYLNESHNKDITGGLLTLINKNKLSILPKLNKYIPIRFIFPPIPDVTMTNMSLRTRDKYLSIYYNLEY